MAAGNLRRQKNVILYSARRYNANQESVMSIFDRDWAFPIGVGIITANYNTAIRGYNLVKHWSENEYWERAQTTHWKELRNVFIRSLVGLAIIVPYVYPPLFAAFPVYLSYGLAVDAGITILAALVKGIRSFRETPTMVEPFDAPPAGQVQGGAHLGFLEFLFNLLQLGNQGDPDSDIELSEMGSESEVSSLMSPPL